MKTNFKFGMINDLSKTEKVSEDIMNPKF